MVTVDFVGRVGNTPLPPRRGLSPLFEAIFNSIHAIQEANITNGQIDITVVRDTTNLLITDDEQIRIAPISGFVISDNGIGFTSDNFNSFSTSDTQKKKSIGGKGVGRFLWLKAFDSVNINSIFQFGGEFYERTFEFALRNEPIINHKCEAVENITNVETTITLIGLKKQFLEYMPRNLDVVAYRIIEHCLEFFVLGIMPKISIRDERETIELNDKYNKMVSENAKSEFMVSGQEFSLIHFVLKSHTGMSHKLNFCAVHRVVDDKKLDSKTIPNLPSRLPSSDCDEEFIYMAYLSSPFLDSHVNQQRTGFDTYSEGQIDFLGDLPWNEIEKKALESVREYLQPYIEPISVEKWKKLEEYVQTEAPQYRSLLKFRQNNVNEIPPDAQAGKLDLELYKIQKQWDIDMRETANEIISSPSLLLVDEDQEIKDRYVNFLEEWNENGKAALAKYVVHRKTTLELLEKYMQSNEDGGYRREKTIHQLIFPLKMTSDDIGYEQQNLWVIDEKLAFHRYLSSDLELRQVNGLGSDEPDRPDLLIFDNPIAIVDNEPINGVTIFEFKRPMRKDSNPVSQMYGYVRKIRNGNALTNHGRSIVVIEETPFYCYAVCDLPPRLRYELEDMGMMKTPDNEGYFNYNSTLRAYVEVVSYDKLLRDAKQRNRVLFEKLNITK